MLDLNISFLISNLSKDIHVQYWGTHLHSWFWLTETQALQLISSLLLFQWHRNLLKNTVQRFVLYWTCSSFPRIFWCTCLYRNVSKQRFKEVSLPFLYVFCQVYGTGYGAGGRLGIGGTDSVSTPTLLESIQHVHIKRVAVNSGGKHTLALSVEGEVYSWGEGEDGKLGHGNRT